MKFTSQTTERRDDRVPSGGELDSLSDADLLDGWVRDQHPAALAALVQRYSVMVLSVCRRRCRSDADADDAFQSTFLYLARNSHKIRQPERLAGWLHRVAQRAAVATTQSSKRETEPMVEPTAAADDPLGRLTQRHEAIVLDEELSELPEHYRSALVMHVYEDRPLQYLAEHFGTTIGSIRGRLQRGKQMLAKRLRHRGVVPILAFAAANALTVTASGAEQASESFIESTSEGNLPDPPIDPALLESLLAQGVRLMPTIYTTAGAMAGLAFLAFALTAGEPPQGDATGGSKTVTLRSAPSAEQAGATGQVGAAVTAEIQVAKAPQNNTSQPTSGGQTGGGQTGRGQSPSGGPFGAQPTPPLVWTDKPVIPTPTTKIAQQVNTALDTEVGFEITTTLGELAGELSKLARIPVLIDERGIEFAQLDLSELKVHIDRANVPLRTALRTILRPHGLRAVVENEGLVITADPATLVHQGIGASRWINVNEEAAKRILDTLQEETQLELVDLPLSDAMQRVGQQHALPIVIDGRALEEIGLATDQPVTIAMGGVTLNSALVLMLSDMDLVLTIQGETLMVTTQEMAEYKLLSRIYWLESTGIAAGDYQTITELIETSIDPDTWEELGGPSTIAPLGSSRPGLLISTTFEVHQNIDHLLKTLRESHFGVDPVLERVQVPSSQTQGVNGGGGGGGGFF